MTTDDERRRVARNIRENYIRGGMGYRIASAYNIALAVGIVPEMIVEDIELWNRLADLIDPDTTTPKSSEITPKSSDTTATHTDATATCDMSQDCRDNVACDPTERGIDSIYEWCFSGIEGADGAEDELYCAIMSAIEDYRHPERATAHTVRPVDRDALLALADELEQETGSVCGVCMGKTARRIREALGVVA